jgi:uroporphyrin-III C-methyltransferase
MGISHLISIVGAGPGDPELLTLKALNRLKNADVVLYDALTGDEILDFANPGSIKIYVGKLYKDGQDQVARQNEIHTYFLDYAAQHKKVVRLKSGDPMIFGRGAEEVRFCKENNLNYEVVPGVTAGVAASAYFDIPLTERGKSGMVLFCAGYRSNDCLSNLDTLVKILQTGSPAVIYMGLNILAELAVALIGKSIEGITPVQILSKISHSTQKIYSTTLSNVSAFLEQVKPESPSTVIIGKYAEQI